jgi:hypothetical protein
MRRADMTASEYLAAVVANARLPTSEEAERLRALLPPVIEPVETALATRRRRAAA